MWVLLGSNQVPCTGPDCPICRFIGAVPAHAVCGARTPEVKADGVTPVGVCNLAPHSVELLAEGDPNHTRYHQQYDQDGTLLAEWSSILPSDDVGRLWPDGTVGPRPLG